MKRAVFLLLLIMMIFAGRAYLAPKEDVKKGNALYEKGDFAAAAKAYNDAAGRAPNDGIPNFNSGAALYKKDSYERAIDSFNKAIASSKKRLIAMAD